MVLTLIPRMLEGTQVWARLLLPSDTCLCHSAGLSPWSLSAAVCVNTRERPPEHHNFDSPALVSWKDL